MKFYLVIVLMGVASFATGLFLFSNSEGDSIPDPKAYLFFTLGLILIVFGLIRIIAGGFGNKEE